MSEFGTTIPENLETSDPYLYESCDVEDTATPDPTPTPSTPEISEPSEASQTLYSAAAGLLQLTAGCTSSPSSDPVTTPVPHPKYAEANAATVTIASNITELVPIFTNKSLNINIARQLFLPLYDKHVKENGEIEYIPVVAASEPVQSDDGKSLTITIRNDINWSDGQRVTINDVAYAMDLQQDPANGSPWLDTKYLSHYTIDETNHSITYYFNEAIPLDYQMKIVNNEPLPQHAFDAKNRRQFLTETPVVNGPFTIESWKNDESLVLVKNENYTAGEPAFLDKIVIKIVTEYTSRLTQLQNGESYVLLDPEVQDLPTLANFHIENSEKWSQVTVIAWNTIDEDHYKQLQEETRQRELDQVDSLLDLGIISDEEAQEQKSKIENKSVTINWAAVKPHPILGSQSVRQALAMGMNLSDFYENDSGALLANGLISPDHCPSCNEDVTNPYSYDPERAKALLAEEGWEDLNGDGILEKDIDGVPGYDPQTDLRFEIDIMYNSAEPATKRNIVLIQSQLLEIGVQLHADPLEFNALVSNMQKHSFDASTFYYSVSFPLSFGSAFSCTSNNNFSGFCTEELENLQSQAIAQESFEESQALWKEIQTQSNENQNLTPLLYGKARVASHPYLRGVANGQDNYPFHTAHLWYWDIPEDEAAEMTP